MTFLGSSEAELLNIMLNQSLLEEQSVLENDMVSKAGATYGDVYNTASTSIILLNECIDEVDRNSYLFMQYLSQTRASLMLALLSAVRKHETQTYMNLRQALESAVLAAYGLSKPDFSEHGSITEDKMITLNDKVKSKAYSWLQKEFPTHSKNIKALKDHINSYAAHSNFLNSASTFVNKGHGFVCNFFDTNNIFLIKSQIWITADTSMGLLMLITDVVKKYPLISFIKGLDERSNILLSEVRAQRDNLKELYKSKHRD